MQDFKLKLILSVLAGMFFSFIFILLALSLPIKDHVELAVKPKGKLQEVAHSLRK